RTLFRLAAPTVALMLLQAVIAAGEAAFVGRLGSAALAGVSLSFPLVMLMTTLSAGGFGGGGGLGGRPGPGGGGGGGRQGTRGNRPGHVRHPGTGLDGRHAAVRAGLLHGAGGQRPGPGSGGPVL